jgi:hypothetical protein
MEVKTMPSPVHGQYYKRAGGAWRKKKGGHSYRHVGSGKGNYAKRSVTSDRKRKAQKSSKRKRYPQEYD